LIGAPAPGTQRNADREIADDDVEQTADDIPSSGAVLEDAVLGEGCSSGRHITPGLTVAAV
jgi:hypothetical protein